eukprot:SAG31_NODE_18527_length_633_cov_0.698502_1_plen_137_part_10
MSGGGGSGTTGSLHIRVDDQSTFYYNGELLGSSDVQQWQTTQTFHIDAPCDGSPHPVLAVHGTDAAGVSAILASWDHCGTTTSTDLGCRCTSEDPRNGQSDDDISWTSATFDDSHWPLAADGGINGADPWGENPDID